MACMSSEALEHLCMDDSQALPWLWVIEALARSKSVDTSLLIQLVKKIPHVSGEMGKNAREAVSLRILEDLVAGDNQDNGSISDTEDRIEFDPSESCEDVLRQILEEVPEANVKKGGLKMLKWDVKSFIANKRACLTSFTLQKLKDAIVEGTYCVPESLKERSGIAVRNRHNDNNPANGGHFDELVQRLEDSGKNMEVVGPSTNSSFTSAENRHDKLQESVPDRNLLPTKRNRSDVIAEDLERETCNTLTTGYCCDPEREAANKHKQAEYCPNHDSVDVSITACQHDMPVKSSKILVESVETEVRMLDKEAEFGDIEFVASQEAQLVRPGNAVDEDISRNLSSQMQGQNDKIGEGYGLRTSNGTSLAATESPNAVDKAINFKHDYHESGAAEAKDHIEHDQDLESTSSGDEYHEETSDLNSKKNAFMSSQCTYSQDSLADQLNHCMKCNNAGQLLLCSCDTCPIVIHESCLGLTANFDCVGRFYCPFCAYTRVIQEIFEVKKRTSLARKNLAIFTGLNVGRKLQLSERSHKSKRNQSKNDDKLSKGTVPDNQIGCSNGINKKNSCSNLEDGQKTKPSVPSASDRSPCTKKLVEVRLDGQKMQLECGSPSRQGVSQVLLPLKISDSLILSDMEIDFSNGNGRFTRTRECKKMKTESASPAESPHRPTESNEEESDDSAASNYSARFEKDAIALSLCSAYPAIIPQIRRKKLPWTSTEEEKLKEGVESFCNASDRTISWKYILGYEADVFRRSRYNRPEG